MSWSSRLELRSGNLEDKWGLFTGFYHELENGLAYSLRLNLFETDSESQGRLTEGDLRMSAAYRPSASRWIFLDRLDLAFENNEDPLFRFRNRRLVNNLNANLQLEKSQISLKYGAKYVLDTIDAETLRGFTDAVGLEVRHDLGKRFDIGARGLLRHSWDADVLDSSYGVSLGYRLATNLWVSFGYNFRGFRDSDFGDSDYTAQGPFFQFRYKLDHQTVKDLLTRSPEGR